MAETEYGLCLWFIFRAWLHDLVSQWEIGVFWSTWEKCVKYTSVNNLQIVDIPHSCTVDHNGSSASIEVVVSLKPTT